MVIDHNHSLSTIFLCDEELRAEIEKAKELFYAAKLEDEDLI